MWNDFLSIQQKSINYFDMSENKYHFMQENILYYTNSGDNNENEEILKNLLI